VEVIKLNAMQQLKRSPKQRIRGPSSSRQATGITVSKQMGPILKRISPSWRKV